MRKLPYVRQGQLFTTDMLNSIIKAINDSIITQPDYQQMMNDLATITNQYTSKIDSFILQYKDVVDNTPTLLELLKAYAELKSRTEEQSSVNGVLGSIKFNFVYNPNSNDGSFPANENGYPDIGENITIKQGDAVIVSYPPNQEELPDKVVFVLCSESIVVPNWLSLDVVVGPQGPEGAQGVQGAQGTPGKDGKDGKIINIRGELPGKDLTTINIQEQLTQREIKEKENGTPLKIDDAYIYDNINDPQIFVYVGENSLYHSPSYDHWSIIRNIRGPQGPAGIGTKVEFGYSETSTSEIFTGIDKDTIDKYYFLCIRTTEPGSETKDYIRIRFRQPEISYTPELKWSYTDIAGKSKVYKEINNEGLPFSLQTPTIDITETVEKKLFQLNLEDVGEIAEADINEEGQLIFRKKYKHIPDALNPKVAEIKTINNVKKFIKVDDTVTAESTNAVKSSGINTFVETKKQETLNYIDAKDSETLQREEIIVNKINENDLNHKQSISTLTSDIGALSSTITTNKSDIENKLTTKTKDLDTRITNLNSSLTETKNVSATKDELNKVQEQTTQTKTELNKRAPWTELEAGNKIPRRYISNEVGEILSGTFNKEHTTFTYMKDGVSIIVPTTKAGQTGTIYYDTKTKESYGWDSSDPGGFLKTGSSLALGSTRDDAFPGDQGEKLKSDTSKNASDISNLKTNQLEISKKLETILVPGDATTVNKSANASQLGGHDPSYYAVASDLNDIMQGTITVPKSTNSDKLNGQPSSYYATSDAIKGITQGTTTVAKATNSDKLGDQLPSYYAKADDLKSYAKDNAVVKLNLNEGTAASTWVTNAITAKKVSKNLTLTLNGGESKKFDGAEEVSLDITAKKIGAISTDQISITPTEGKEGYVDKSKLSDYATDAGTLGTHATAYFATSEKVTAIENKLNAVSETATTAKSKAEQNAVDIKEKLENLGQAADSKKLNGKLESELSVATAAECTGNAATATTAAECTGNAATATTAAECTGNAATATTAAECTGNAATATIAETCTGNSATATDVTTNINGKAITNIFEADGITAKKAAGLKQQQISTYTIDETTHRVVPPFHFKPSTAYCIEIHWAYSFSPSVPSILKAIAFSDGTLSQTNHSLSFNTCSSVSESLVYFYCGTFWDKNLFSLTKVQLAKTDESQNKPAEINMVPLVDPTVSDVSVADLKTLKIYIRELDI